MFTSIRTISWKSAIDQRMEHGAKVEIETDLGDYEKIGGVFVPFSIEVGREGFDRQAEDHPRKSRGQRAGRRRHFPLPSHAAK